MVHPPSLQYGGKNCPIVTPFQVTRNVHSLRIMSLILSLQLISLCNTGSQLVAPTCEHYDHHCLPHHHAVVPPFVHLLVLQEGDLVHPHTSRKLVILLRNMSSNLDKEAILQVMKQLEEKHDNITSSLQNNMQLITEQILAGATNAVRNAIAPIAARQEAFKQQTDVRLEKLYGDVQSISNLVTEMHSSNHEISYQSVPSPVSTTSSMSFSSHLNSPQSCSIPSPQTSRSIISSCSRTLGFFPIVLPPECSPQVTSNLLATALEKYLKESLHISDSELSHIETKTNLV